jgi:hypothetical protein
MLFHQESHNQHVLIQGQEGWIAKHAVSEEDRQAAQQAPEAADDDPMDPMQGLEGLDEAGPKPA